MSRRRRGGGYRQRVQRHDLPAPEVTIDGNRARASTQLGYAGAYSVTLSTTLPQLGLELHSTYLGHRATATLAAHLTLTPKHRDLHTTLHDRGELPVAGAGARRPGARGRGALLLDHLAELRSLIAQNTGAPRHSRRCHRRGFARPRASLSPARPPGI